MAQAKTMNRASLADLKWGLCLLLGTTLLCSTASQADLKQRKFIGRYIYHCEGGAKVIEDLFQRQDSGYHQVVLGLPNGNTIALQQIETGEAIRFTDDIQYMWTLKGNRAVLDEWVAPDQWRPRWAECEHRNLPATALTNG